VTGTLLKAVVVLVPVCLLLGWSLASFFKARTAWEYMQLLGAVCLLVVVLVHICEALELFPSMGWGSSSSPGHYLDLSSAVLGLLLFPVGFLGRDETLVKRLCGNRNARNTDSSDVLRPDGHVMSRKLHAGAHAFGETAADRPRISTTRLL
jgi:hypothetical protein